MLTPRRRPFAPVILAVAFFCATGSAARAAQQSFTGVVTHVADGDTLDVTTGQRSVTIRPNVIGIAANGTAELICHRLATTSLRLRACLVGDASGVDATTPAGRNWLIATVHEPIET